MAKLTRQMKEQLNSAVTGETKRCLAIIQRIVDAHKDADAGVPEILSDLKYGAIKEIVEGSPYLEFHPELLKRIPK